MKYNSIFLILVLSLSIYIHFRVNQSFIEQTILLYEFNSYQLNLPLEVVEDFNSDFPNISTTTLPLKMMKARYYMRDSISDKALKLYKEAIIDNPYLGISEFEIGKYYYNFKKYDSAYSYLKNSANKLPRNDMFSRLYYLDLAKLKKESELDSSFLSVKYLYKLDQWKDYLFTKLEINPENKSELLPLLDEAKKYLDDEIKLRTLETILNVGYDKLDELSQIVTNAEIQYEREFFNESAILNLKAASMDPSEYVHFENAALAYYRDNNFEEAERLFRYVLRNFTTSKNGKSEFYLGMLLYEKKMNSEACQFWDISLNKGYNMAQSLIKTFCLE